MYLRQCRDRGKLRIAQRGLRVHFRHLRDDHLLLALEVVEHRIRELERQPATVSVRVAAEVRIAGSVPLPVRE